MFEYWLENEVAPKNNGHHNKSISFSFHAQCHFKRLYLKVFEHNVSR